jgi:hypothetical protein
MKIKELELLDISNEEYHAQQSRSEHYYSSSQLKDILKDPELFYQKYIAQTLEREKKAVFDIGTYFHTAILEPHLLEEECKVWHGGRRSGKAWKEFQEEHEGKVIITSSEEEQAKTLIKGIEESPLCLEHINDPEAKAELSLFLTLLGVRCKVRFDLIKLTKEESWIGDLKSTTGSVKGAWDLRQKVDGFSYDLSAAFYVDMVNEYIKRNNLPYASVENFYLYFSSKTYPVAKRWTMSKRSLAVGRKKYQTALREILKYEKQDWEFYDEEGSLDPMPWTETEWCPEASKENKKDELDDLL